MKRKATRPSAQKPKRGKKRKPQLEDDFVDDWDEDDGLEEDDEFGLEDDE